MFVSVEQVLMSLVKSLQGDSNNNRHSLVSIVLFVIAISFTWLVSIHSTLDNPLTNIIPVLLKLPGSNHIYSPDFTLSV